MKYFKLFVLCLALTSSPATAFIKHIKQHVKQNIKQVQIARHPINEFNLGVKYDEGKGVPRSYPVAKKWYEKAALKGFAPAEYNLGVMYKLGHGVKQDYRMAAEWIKKAADQGYSKAYFSLANMYYNGDGLPKDRKKALVWYRKSCADGVEFACSICRFEDAAPK